VSCCSSEAGKKQQLGGLVTAAALKHIDSACGAVIALAALQSSHLHHQHLQAAPCMHQSHRA
jgi:hypothetical protein